MSNNTHTSIYLRMEILLTILKDQGCFGYFQWL